MKTRSGFVSNSSSSSFVINGNNLSFSQAQSIKNHVAKAKELGLDCGCDEPWSIYEEGNFLKGSTSMGNFDMWAFLSAIGVRSEHIDWDCD